MGVFYSSFATADKQRYKYSHPLTKSILEKYIFHLHQYFPYKEGDILKKCILQKITYPWVVTNKEFQRWITYFFALYMCFINPEVARQDLIEIANPRHLPSSGFHPPLPFEDKNIDTLIYEYNICDYFETYYLKHYAKKMFPLGYKMKDIDSTLSFLKGDLVVEFRDFFSVPQTDISSGLFKSDKQFI